MSGIYVDYAKSVMPAPVGVLYAAGVVAVGRYIGWDGQPGYQDTGKNLTKAEADQLIAGQFEIFLAFEYAADAAAHGAPQGTLDGELAAKQLDELGAPAGMGVYFACDFDVTDYDQALADTPENAVAKLGPVGEYFRAINDLKPDYQVCAYGDFYVIRRLIWAGLIKLGWQTIAWSGGQWDGQDQVVLRQLVASISIEGISADVDVRMQATSKPDFGQWPRPVTPSDWRFGKPSNLTIRPGRHNFHASWDSPGPAGSPPQAPDLYQVWVYEGTTPDMATLVRDSHGDPIYPRAYPGTETAPDAGGLKPSTEYTVHVAASDWSGQRMGAYVSATFTTSHALL